ncbi:septum formation initiator family protein [Glycocaulis profundi]|nr:septum formation initiator family protein [Glycocaulis profundi]
MKTLKRFIPTLALFVVIAYLGYHALHGEQGYPNYLAVQARIADTEVELGRVQAERAHLEDRVTRLSSGNGELDLDFLEERARSVLNFAHPHEIIVKIETDSASY